MEGIKLAVLLFFFLYFEWTKSFVVVCSSVFGVWRFVSLRELLAIAA